MCRRTAYDRYAVDPYYQHNPTLGDGITAAKQYFTTLFAGYPDFGGSTKRVIAEGPTAQLSRDHRSMDNPSLPPTSHGPASTSEWKNG